MKKIQSDGPCLARGEATRYTHPMHGTPCKWCHLPHARQSSQKKHNRTLQCGRSLQPSDQGSELSSARYDDPIHDSGRGSDIECMYHGQDIGRVGEGGGLGLGPKVCVPKMARPDFPNCKFCFFPHEGPFGLGKGSTGGGGDPSSDGVRPF